MNVGEINRAIRRARFPDRADSSADCRRALRACSGTSSRPICNSSCTRTATAPSSPGAPGPRSSCSSKVGTGTFAVRSLTCASRIPHRRRPRRCSGQPGVPAVLLVPAPADTAGGHEDPPRRTTCGRRPVGPNARSDAARNPRTSPPACRLPAQFSSSPLDALGPTPLGVAGQGLVRLARGPRLREARDRRRMAAEALPRPLDRAEPQERPRPTSNPHRACVSC